MTKFYHEEYTFTLMGPLLEKVTLQNSIPVWVRKLRKSEIESPETIILIENVHKIQYLVIRMTYMYWLPQWTPY